MVDEVEDGEKFPGEEPEEESDGEILDADGALVHAANVLMLAQEKADYANDTQALMKIAGGWMEIHEYLAGVPHHAEKKQPLGFAPAKPAEVEEEEELDDAVAAEGKSIRWVHSQHGKLREPTFRYRRRG